MSRYFIHLPWREKTWSERVQTALASIVAGIFGALVVLGALAIVVGIAS
jgi:hypothetical protein